MDPTPTSIPTPIVIESDNREKKPIPFPPFIRFKGQRLPTQIIRTPLPAGDYRLASHPSCCIVERKSGLSELYQNLFTADTPRQVRAFERLALSCTHPILLLELSLHELYLPSSDPTFPPPDDIAHRLFLSAAAFNLSLLWVPTSSNRYHLGNTILNLLLTYAYAPPPRIPMPLPSPTTQPQATGSAKSPAKSPKKSPRKSRKSLTPVPPPR